MAPTNPPIRVYDPLRSATSLAAVMKDYFPAIATFRDFLETSLEGAGQAGLSIPIFDEIKTKLSALKALDAATSLETVETSLRTVRQMAAGPNRNRAASGLRRSYSDTLHNLDSHVDSILQDIGHMETYFARKGFKGPTGEGLFRLVEALATPLAEFQLIRRSAHDRVRTLIRIEKEDTAPDETPTR